MACKHTYGKTSDIVIKYYKMLAQLYIDIHEEHHAEVIWKELHEIIIIRHGEGSEEERSTSSCGIRSLNVAIITTTIMELISTFR